MRLTWINGRDEDKHEIEWLGGQLHNYAHLPALAIPAGPTTWNTLERSYRGVTPMAVSHAGPRRVLAWCLLDIPENQAEFISNIADAYGKTDGNPMLVAHGSIGTDNETDLREYLVRSSESRSVLQSVARRLQMPSGRSWPPRPTPAGLPVGLFPFTTAGQ